jgi:hypothetical protein
MQLKKLADLWAQDDETTYFAAARKAVEESERLLREGTAREFGGDAAAWSTDTLRADVNSRG